ncbi:MAG TPA: FG-GAP-like repeat-containing protein [Usitatibacteraceae bacterium]|nr:FG-GAP-like repeat-containing protein [Usitatibacteraceae bacterium]
MSIQRTDSPAIPASTAGPRAGLARAMATAAALLALAPAAWSQSIVAGDINIANQAAYGVSGNCTVDAAAVTVSIGAVNVTPSPTCSGTSYATGPVDVSSLADGPVTITVDDTSGPINTIVQKDTAAPTVGIDAPAPVNAANVAAYTLTGTCSEDTRNVNLTVTDSGAGVINAPIVCGAVTSGTFTITGDLSSLADGAISFAVTHDDAVGNTANANAGTTKDTVLPTVAIDPPATINAANVATYTLTGTCSENGRDVSVIVTDGVTPANVTASCGAVTPGTFAITGDLSAFADGTIGFGATHTDAAGNTGNATAAFAMKDTVAPTVAFNTPAPVNAANVATYTLTGTCSENGVDVSIIVTDGVTPTNVTAGCGAVTPGTFSITGDLSAFAEGAIGFGATHTDAAGNTGNATTAFALKDTAPPAAPAITSPTEASTVSANPTISGTAEPDAIVTVREGPATVCVSGPATGGNWSCASTLGAGAHTITATAADAVGNVSPASTAVNFTVGASPQTITFAPLPDRLLGAGGFTVSATASSSLTVSFSSLTMSVCTVSGTSVTPVALGTCTVAADQAGDASWLPAPQVTQSFLVLAGIRGDVNADLRADVFWREPGPATGVSWWTLNGTTVLGANYYDVPAEWQIADVGDLNGDGKADLVWRRSTDGATFLWLLDGFVPSGYADLGVLDPATWTLLGSTDLNADGKYDLLWRSTAGELYGWIMDGGTITAQASMGVPATVWQVIDLADMNGDGKGDIVFRNTGTGEVWLRMLDGLTTLTQGSAGTLDPATWNLLAAADFDGDGKGDLLWQSTAGDTWVWIMNGTAFVSAGSLGNPGAGWTVRSVADTDGDGKADIIWRHTDGTTYVWKMDGAAVTSFTPMAQPGGTWQIVAP